jgi:hypothetical protein
MSNERVSDNNYRAREDKRTWEGGFGQSRFRAQWDRRPGYVQFNFQGPFTQNNDPDGIGVAFSSDFGITWEREHGARIYGEYWNTLQDRWRDAGRDVRTLADKALAELEERMSSMRREQNTNQSESQTLKNGQGPRAQRIPIEYDKTYDPFENESAEDQRDTISPRLSKDEYDTRRRAILQELRAGMISIEEAELLLNNLT